MDKLTKADLARLDGIEHNLLKLKSKLKAYEEIKADALETPEWYANIDFDEGDKLYKEGQMLVELLEDIKEIRKYAKECRE